MANGATIASVLAGCPLFAGLPSSCVLAAAEASRIQRFPPGTDVFTEGQSCGGLWVVAAGQVRTYHAAADGRQQVVGLLSPGAALDLGAALDSRPFSTTAAATGEAALVFTPRRVLAVLLQRYPEMTRNAIDCLCLELRQRDLVSAIAGLKDARGRVCCTVLRLADQYGEPEGNRVAIGYRLTRRDVADASGVTLETAIRALSWLQGQGVLRTERQYIEILDVDQLREITRCYECQFGCTFADAAPVARERGELLPLAAVTAAGA